MKNKSTFVFLPTDKTTNIYSDYNGGLHTKTDEITVYLGNNSKFQHLYILSDDEIKEGDWYLTRLEDGSYPVHADLNPRKCSEASYDFTNCKKIIATTNPELLDKLIESSHFDSFVSKSDVATISQSDIKYIIDLYNGKGKELDKVDVYKLATKEFNYECNGRNHLIGGFEIGYNKCLSDNADKKFTIQEVAEIVHCWKGAIKPDELNKWNLEGIKKFIQSLTEEQPKRDTIMVEYEEHLVDRDGNEPQHEDRVEGSILKPKLNDGCIIITRDKS